MQLRMPYFIQLTLLAALVIGHLGQVQLHASDHDVVSGQKPNIYILHSFHQHFSWTQSIQTGIDEVLHNPEYELIVDYLDSHRYRSAKDYPSIKSRFSARFQNRPPSLLIVSDYPALEAAIKLRNDLAPSLTVLFCGINPIEFKRLVENKGEPGNIGGIFEIPAYEETLIAIKQLRKNPSRIIVIDSQENPGQPILQKNINKYFPNINIYNIIDRDFESIANEADSFEADAVILVNTTLRFKNGALVPAHTVSKVTETHCKAPVFSFWDVAIQMGAVGGCINSGTEHGIRVAKQAVNLIQNPNSTRFETRGASVHTYHYPRLMKHKLNPEKLPNDSILLESPSDSISLSQEIVQFIILSAIFLILLIVLQFRHIRRHKANEERIRETERIVEHNSAELETTVHNRTRELSETSRQASELAESRGEFLSVLSHEVRTPLNGIYGMSELLLGTRLNNEQEDYAITIHNSARALIDLLNDVLDLRKLEQSKMALDPIPTNIQRILQDTLHLFNAQAKDKGLDLRLYYDKNAPKRIICDPTRIRQILNNFISNAIKFSQIGEIRIRVDAVNREHHAGHVTMRFSVHDSGIGMAPEEMGHIFDGYRQANSGIAREFGGTGLGLAISKELAELMKGNIDVQSERGKGSTFSFTASFPLIDLSSSAARPDLSRLHIIALGVEEPYLQDYKENIKKMGARFEYFTAARAGLQAAATHTSKDADTMILIGNNISDMNSSELLRQIRRLNVEKHPNIIRLHQLPAEAELEQAHGHFFDAIISYSSGFEHLLQCMEELNASARKDSGERKAKSDVYLGVNVLLVDDNDINLRVAQRMFETLGCTVHCAGNGREAITATEEKDIDIIFMDCLMPVMDGLEATEKIRNGQSPAASIPIVALTANSTEADEAACIAAGMDTFVSKPVSKKDLSRILARYFSTAALVYKRKRSDEIEIQQAP